MAIKPPPLKGTPALLCDWMEMRVAIDPHSRFSFAQLKRAWDVNRETEDSDPEGVQWRESDTDNEGVSGEDSDVFLDSVVEEFSERSEALGEAYPFATDSRGTYLQLKDNLTSGGHVYLFCLLLTHSKKGDVLDGTSLPAVTNQTRDLFQACATLAAAGVLTGCAISFGWPRPGDNPPFLQRLREVYALFGEGEVVTAPRPGVSPSPKDEEIDVIAWRPTHDRAPGTEYLLGQVASGDNWQAKSIKGPPIINFHRSWFTLPPASEPRPSIFIPQVITENKTGDRRDRMDKLTAIYGTVVDRLRLPRFAATGIALADGPPPNPYYIERRNDVPAIIEWVSQQISSIRASFINA